MSSPATRPPGPGQRPTAQLWRTSPSNFGRLNSGLALFGAGEGLLVASELGNSPWTVLAEGAALNSALSVGAATVVISFIVLMLWIPLRQRPGLGTIANAIVVGVALGLVLDAVGTGHPLALRWVLMFGGIALVAVGSGFYLTAALGPGPRDGLMTGLHMRTGRSLRLVRVSIELSVLVTGVILGGTAGVGTLAFALLIGPGVQAAVERLATPRWRELISGQ